MPKQTLQHMQPVARRALLPMRPKSTALNHSTRSTFMMHGDGSLSWINLPLHSAFPPARPAAKGYWQRVPESNQESNPGNQDNQGNQGGGPSQDHLSRAIQAEVSLTETSSVDGENNTSPSEAPEPSSRSQQPGSPVSPITIGSTDVRSKQTHRRMHGDPRQVIPMSRLWSQQALRAQMKKDGSAPPQRVRRPKQPARPRHRGR